MSLFDNKYYKTGKNVKNLVVFIHGYNGSPEAIDYAIQSLRGKLNDAVIVVPRAPYLCEKDADNLQWLSFYKEDPEVRFRNPEASVEEIWDIFNRLGNDFAEVAQKMNEFVTEQQSKWDVDDSHTFLAGFSQGAMIAIYASLIRKTEIAGCIEVAGIIAGSSKLEQEIISRPKFLLLHGKDDATVQYKTFEQTIGWFNQQKLQYCKYEFEGVPHRMNDEEMRVVADFVNSGGKDFPTL